MSRGYRKKSFLFLRVVRWLAASEKTAAYPPPVGAWLKRTVENSPNQANAAGENLLKKCTKNSVENYASIQFTHIHELTIDIYI